jgi:hypothetical protein
MIRIRRWVVGKRKKVVWSEPKLPPYVKFKPDADTGIGDTIQPGDLSMGIAAREFLAMEDDEEEAPL